MATISSLTPTPGFFPEATVNAGGTGLGASPGNVYIAFTDQGVVLELGYNTWSATSITNIALPDLDTLDNNEVVLPATAVIIALPVGAVTGARSASFSFTVDTSPITSFAHDTLILGGPTATSEGFFGEQPAPIQPPLLQPIGRIDSFNNPGYDVKWSIDFQFTSASGGFDQTDFSIVGATVAASLSNLGINIPLIDGGGGGE